MFAHERTVKDAEYPSVSGCGFHGPYGTSTCKYGFYKSTDCSWCKTCDGGTDFQDMALHEKRFREVCRQPDMLQEVRERIQMPSVG
jgi:hypothetical protein